MNNETDPVIGACETEWDAWKGDCSGFAKAVAARLGFSLSGQANELVDYLQRSPDWRSLGNDSRSATTQANLGDFVIGGLKARPHGHVVVVVKSGASPYPVAYWGRFGAVGKKNTAINFSWRRADLSNVLFFSRKL
ncbi:MAG: hypothetical protein ACXWC4_19940 [Telluria sp.]